MRICRPWITVRGKRIYAYEHGLKAFCFDVDEEKPRKGTSKTSSPDGQGLLI